MCLKQLQLSNYNYFVFDCLCGFEFYSNNSTFHQAILAFPFSDDFFNCNQNFSHFCRETGVKLLCLVFPTPPLSRSPLHGFFIKTSLKNIRSGFWLPYRTKTIGIRAFSHNHCVLGSTKRGWLYCSASLPVEFYLCHVVYFSAR